MLMQGAMDDVCSVYLFKITQLKMSHWYSVFLCITGISFLVREKRKRATLFDRYNPLDCSTRRRIVLLKKCFFFLPFRLQR